MGEYALLVGLGVIALVAIAFHIQMRRQGTRSLLIDPSRSPNRGSFHE